MTCAPVRAAKAATAELSTPPDMATTILASAAGRPRSKLIGMGASLPEVHPSRLDAKEGIGGESHLSRLERDFEAAGEAPPGSVPNDQREAIACYLSAGEGWSEAMKRLRGAFASEAAA